MPLPVAIDLCCCSGGATRGYQLAGFDVFGVDIDPQPDYIGRRFLQADVTTLDLSALAESTGAVFIGASPPCQKHSRLRFYQPQTIDERYADLIAVVRDKARATGLPYVIENVPGAPLIDPIELCGCMFRDLRMYRPRQFESNIPLVQPEAGDHTPRCARNGYLPTPERPYMTITGGKHSKAWQRAACEAMGTPWLAVKDGEDIQLGIRKVSEAIPPLYTEYIGRQVMAHLALVGDVAA